MQHFLSRTVTLLRRQSASLGALSKLGLALIGLLLLGCVFRVANLDQKVFWVDEVATVTRAVGYTQSAVMTQLADGALHSPAELLAYQQLSPERTLGDTLQALARSPEHAPLYFGLIRIWMQVFGSSVGAVRSLSVVSSGLTLPCLYYFCRWLFNPNPPSSDSVVLSRTCWIAVSLMAVSPFFIAYAQEARPYSFWLLILVLSWSALLRAIQRPTVRSWFIYAVALTVSLYTSLLTLLLVIGQGGYVWADGGRLNARRFLGAVGIALLAFLPWLWVIASHWQALGSNTTWMRTSLNPLVMLAIWLYSFAILFFDVPIVTQGGMAVLQATIAAGVLATIGVALYHLRRMPCPIGWGLAGLGLPIPIGLIFLDLVFQGQASATARYLIPAQLAVLIAVASFLAAPTELKPRKRLQQMLLSSLIVLSLISNWVNFSRSPDYQKDRNRHNPEIAAILNQDSRTVLLAEPEQTMDLLSLSHSLNSGLKIQILPTAQVPAVLAQCQPYFLFNPSDALFNTLQQAPNLILRERFQPDLLTPADVHLSLWSVQPSPTRIECSTSG